MWRRKCRFQIHSCGVRSQKGIQMLKTISQKCENLPFYFIKSGKNYFQKMFFAIFFSHYTWSFALCRSLEIFFPSSLKVKKKSLLSENVFRKCFFAFFLKFRIIQKCGNLPSYFIKREKKISTFRKCFSQNFFAFILEQNPWISK